MEICKYPYSRFEEVCSRILQFYFNPKADHGFGNLWLASLLGLVKESRLSDMDNVIVQTEENAEGKRIDITIVSDKFVIGIENKTTADLYNPLDKYKSHIQKTYKGKDCKLLVLSVKPITEISARKKLSENDFVAITYRGLFDAVRAKLGSYLADCNHNYLTFMLDFMKTIDNMDSPLTCMENEFFFQHQETLDELMNRYNNYKERILSTQIGQISILQERISVATGRNWWVYKGWDLGIDFNENGHRIGIESNYQVDKDNPCALFHICITTWNRKDWFPYEEQVLQQFPDYVRPIVYKGNRSYLYLPVLQGNDHDKIIETLKSTFDKMTEITSKIR